MTNHESQSTNHESRLWTSGTAIVAYLALAKLLAHLLTAGRYGYFRDELYYLACGEHLDWGYVDQPPFVALAAWFARYVLGGSLLALRLLPALAGAAKVLLAGVLARELGGGRYAQALAALATLVAPAYLSIDGFLSMNTFEPLFWMGCVWALLRLLKGGDPRLWLVFGALAGLGLQNKHSTLFFGFAIVMGLSLSASRRLLREKWLWAGGALAFLIFLPNLLWQAQRGFPTFVLLQNVEATAKNIVLSPLTFLLQQIIILHPLNFPLWLAGLLYFLVAKPARPFRALGWAYLVLLATFIVLHGKHYYLAPIYPMLFAGGAIALERGIARSGRAWLGTAVVLLLLAGGVATAPLAMPILPPEKFAAYERAIGISRPTSERSHLGSPLPQVFSDRFGWEEMTAEVARVYHALPPEEQAKTAIFGGNYGEAGAIDFFGPRYGLPRAISAHQNYWYWGPRDYTGEIVIVLGGDADDLARHFEQVEEVARLHHPFAMPFENRPIFLCRRLRVPLADLWPQIRNWR